MMARLLVGEEDLVVRLSWREVPAARRRSVRVPLSAVRRVSEETSWWRVLRGWPSGGRWVPERFCVGTWRQPSGPDFVAVRPGTPAVVIETVARRPFARLSVSVPDAAAAVREIESRLRLDRPPGAPAPAPTPRSGSSRWHPPP